jgi:hypothetical protein
MQRNLDQLQHSARTAKGPHELAAVLAEAYEGRYISCSDAKDELLNDPKVSRSRLQQRGWTPKMIASLLQAPISAPNPHGYGAPMRLWAIADVVIAEQGIKDKLQKNRTKKELRSAQSNHV